MSERSCDRHSRSWSSCAACVERRAEWELEGSTDAAPRTSIGRQPASLSLDAYVAVAPRVVADLVAEFGEPAALRLLNGKPAEPVAPRPQPAPFDPSLLAPPGAVGLPRAHRSKGRAEIVKAAGW